MENNNKMEILILSIGAVLVLLLLGIYFSELKEYSIIVITLLAINVIVYVLYKFKTRTPESKFKSYVKNIINTYDSILAKVDNLPDLSDRDIVYIDKFEELINVQGETKKPIFYNIAEKTVSFVLIDNNLVCYSIIKENENLIDPIENELLIAKEKKKTKDIDESILADLEQTTIIKLPNIGMYKVSPIRKKDDEKKKITAVDEKNNVKEKNENQTIMEIKENNETNENIEPLVEQTIIENNDCNKLLITKETIKIDEGEEILLAKEMIKFDDNDKVVIAKEIIRIDDNGQVI